MSKNLLGFQTRMYHTSKDKLVRKLPAKLNTLLYGEPELPSDEIELPDGLTESKREDAERLVDEAIERQIRFKIEAFDGYH